MLQRILRHTVLLTLYMVLLHMTAMPAEADIYMYVDEEGVIHFTNVPTASDADYRVYFKEMFKTSRPIYAPDRYDRLIEEASSRYQISAPLIKAIIRAESDFDHLAVSKKGACGLMQIMPENYDELDISDPFDPWENIMGGVKYFRQMLDRFKGKLALSLAAYNAGPTAVERYQDIPPYKETETYVERVLKYYYDYK